MVGSGKEEWRRVLKSEGEGVKEKNRPPQSLHDYLRLSRTGKNGMDIEHFSDLTHARSMFNTFYFL
jgi:hypothetical protein